MKTTLIIACGALAQELVTILKANDWHHVEVRCLPAKWHNTPEKITPAIASLIDETRGQYQSTLVAYGDCGTGGQLDSLLARENIERLPGDHCYSFFAGEQAFSQLAEQELGTFYLTDYLAANFDRLILQDLGIKAHPELIEMYFGHYTRLLYLAQQPSPKLKILAKAAADALGLNYVYRETGLSPFEHSLKHIKIVSA
ncbi:MAG: DUF1638 domain-containing protein [Granulosicoccus sp.]|nr:DUF1638 domain-containing protein [Granulosicoccus sp.]